MEKGNSALKAPSRNFQPINCSHTCSAIICGQQCNSTVNEYVLVTMFSFLLAQYLFGQSSDNVLCILEAGYLLQHCVFTTELLVLRLQSLDGSCAGSKFCL